MRRIQSIEKISKSEYEGAIKKSIRLKEGLENKVGLKTSKDFKIYKPLHEGLRQNSALYLMNNFIIIVYRLILLYSAMYMQDQVWFQVVLFASLCLMYLAYLVFARPFKDAGENTMQVFNVYCTLAISYLVMVLNGLCVESEQFEQVGTEITYLMYVNWSVNAIVILSITAINVKLLCKKYFK